jgi:hypothetical protein
MPDQELVPVAESFMNDDLLPFSPVRMHIIL